MYATLDTLKTCYTGTLAGALLKALNFTRGLNVNQVQDLIWTIESNAFWASKGLYKDDSASLLTYLDKLKQLLQRRMDKGKFSVERDADGLSLKRGHTQLSVGEYQRLYLLNTPYEDLLSLDFCHIVFADPERLRLLTYCEGDIVEKQADSKEQFFVAVANTIEWAEKEFYRPLVHGNYENYINKAS